MFDAPFSQMVINHLVIGAGITGLSLAWKLRCAFPDASILLLENSCRVGGWIQTIQKDGFLFELGPHSVRAGGHGAQTLGLVKELGLMDQLIWAQANHSKRYLYYQGDLRPLPRNLREVIAARWLWSALWGVLKEPFQRRGQAQDESVESMMYRRIGKSATDLLVDPLVKGIYGGRMDCLSAAWAFPTLHRHEKKYGSFLIGALLNPQERSHGIFSFKNGMETLVQALQSKLKENILLNCNVMAIEGKEVICGNGRKYQADHIYDTRPKLTQLPYLGLHVVSLGYRQTSLAREGFGYLMGSSENEDVLGVIWDSSVFSQQNHQKMEVRLTVMVKEEVQDPVATALEAIKRQMQLTKQPDAMHHFHAKEAIIQYPVGYPLKQQVQPSDVCELGTHVSGVSVSDCIAYVSNLVKDLQKEN